MGTRNLVSVQEYLRSSFDGLDREYVDGRVIEGHGGEPPHSQGQCRMVEIFYELRKRQPFHSAISSRMRLGPSRFRIPDVAVFHPDEAAEMVPPTPPLIVIEVVSPEDRHTEIKRRLAEFLAWGVAHVWLVDPWQRQLSVHTQNGLSAVTSFQLPKFDIQITAADIFR